VIRRMLISIGLVAAFSAGTWTAQAQNKKEAHPVLERAIDQINNIKGQLQSAPKDFAGHKQKAIEALNLATDELHQAMRVDK
jgi:hypothetical protein